MMPAPTVPDVSASRHTPARARVAWFPTGVQSTRPPFAPVRHPFAGLQPAGWHYPPTVQTAPKITPRLARSAADRIAAGEQYRDVARSMRVSVSTLHRHVQRLVAREDSDVSATTRTGYPPPTTGDESPHVLLENPPNDEPVIVGPTELPPPQESFVSSRFVSYLPNSDTKAETPKQRRQRLGTGGSTSSARTGRNPGGAKLHPIIALGNDGDGNGWGARRLDATASAPRHFLDRHDPPPATEMRLRDEHGRERAHGWYAPHDALQLHLLHGWERISGALLPEPTADDTGAVTCTCGILFPSLGSYIRHRTIHHADAA